MLAAWQVMPKSYTAKGMILVKSDEIAVKELQGTFSAVAVDLPLVRSQAEALQSEGLIRQVVQQLRLHEDPDFNPPPPAWRAWLEERLSFASTASGPVDPVAAVADDIRKSLTAMTDGRSYVVHVEYKGKDPEKSALLVNTLMENYLQTQISGRRSASEAFNEELSQRLAVLRTKVDEAESRVRAFRREHSLVASPLGGSVDVQSVSELNTRLAAARAERAEAEARYQQALAAARTSSTSSAEVLASPVILALREAEAKLIEDRAELAARFTPGHARLASVETQLADIRARIQDEAADIIASLGHQAQVARAREQELNSLIASLHSEANESTGAADELRALEEEAKAHRQIYEAFLTSAEQAGSAQAVARADANVISWALAPVKPAGPGPATLAIFAGLGSMMLAFGGVMGREVLADRGFNSLEEVAALTGLPALAAVPALTKRQQSPARYVVAQPNSSLAETIRWSLAPLEPREVLESAGRTILVTSALAGEGKTTYAASLGRLMAQDSRRVLLIECDLRRPNLRRTVGGDQPYHLQDILERNCELHEALNVDPASGLHFITGRRQTTNPQSLLQSEAFQALLRDARRHYDHIIIDSPPVMHVFDPMILARYADSVVVVIRKGFAPRRDVGEMLRRLSSATSASVGAVLMRADGKTWDKGIYNGYN